MTLHELELHRRTLHGHFSRDLAPVLTIDPGDSVRFQTLNAGWQLEPRDAPHFEASQRRWEPRDPERDNGHALSGPVAIRGAEPGMTLAIRIDTVRPGRWGVTPSGGRSTPVHRRIGTDKVGTALHWTLDPDAGTGQNQLGHTVALRPFMGVLGVAPAEPGIHSTIPPRVVGGNIDCKELVPGSTLYLPIAVPGALFSVGDGHGLQGDGEVCGTAIECPMERVELQLELLDDMPLRTPRANTPAGWITFGFHEDLNEATLIALEEMVALIAERYKLERAEALGLASLVCDLRITQIVNQVSGVHAVLPHDAIR